MQHGGRIRAAARRLGVNPERILDFSANLNPLGPPAAVMEVLARHLPEVAWYPEPQGGELKQEVAFRLGMTPSQVAVGNGACELIYLLCHTLSPRAALIPCPTFSEYARAVRTGGGRVDQVEMREGSRFRLPTERLVASLRTGRYDLVVICNPNNPTGTLARLDELDAVAQAAERADTWMLVDESFLGFHREAQQLSALGLSSRYRRLMVLVSLTKLYCLPGLRLGYLVGPTHLVTRLEEKRDPWSVNSLAQLAGLECLRQTEYLARTRELLPRYRAGLLTSLTSIPGIHVFPSEANFLLCRLDRTSATDLSGQLAHQHILVRECSEFPGLDSSYLRVAVRQAEENERLVRAIAAVLAPSRGDGCEGVS